MKIKLCDVNPAALDKLPAKTEDKSGVGVHYVDAFLKPMNAKLPDGTPIKCNPQGRRIAAAPRSRPRSPGHAAGGPAGSRHRRGHRTGH